MITSYIKTIKLLRKIDRVKSESRRARRKKTKVPFASKATRLYAQTALARF